MSLTVLGIAFMTIAVTVTIASSFGDKNSRIEKLATKTTTIIQILFFSGLLISYQNYISTTREQDIIRESTLIEKNWIGVYKLIQDRHVDCPDFINSLSYDWQKPKGVIVKTGKDNHESVLNISINIFLSFQNVINYFLYYESDDDLTLWISAFILWTNSDLLYDMWNKYKFMYGNATVTFTNTIFEAVRQNRPNNQEEILKLSKQICKSPEIQNLFKKVKKKPFCG